MKKVPSQFSHDFWDSFLAGMAPGLLAAGFVMATIGIAISLLIQTNKRDPLSERTPIHFSWAFFWRDNALRIVRSVLLTYLVIFVSLRFAENLIGDKVSMFYALIIGLGIDKATDILIKARNKFYKKD